MRTKLLKASVATTAAIMAFAAVPMGVADAPASSFYDVVEAAAIRDSGGDLSAYIGTVNVHHPDGTVTTSAINGHEWLGIAQYLADHVDPGAGMQAAPPSSVGIGIPYPLSLATGWPFCDTVSIFVYHSGAAGASISSTTGQGGAPFHIVCPPGGVGGSGGAWQVEVTPSAAPGVLTACGVAMLMSGSITQPVGLGGYACNNWSTGCNTYLGDLLTINFGFLTLDYAAGALGSVQLANAGQVTACS